MAKRPPEHTLRIPLASLLSILAVFFHSAPTRASIFDRDDRVTEERPSTRFRSVGLIRESAKHGFATAFLVSECHALTAKHVIHHSNPIGRTATLRFEPSRRSSSSNTTSGIVVAAGGRPAAIADISQDWALLQLDRCLGRTFGFLRLSNVPLKIRTDRLGIAPGLAAVGFPYDRKHRGGPTIDPRCEVKLITSYGLLHDCATLPGNSGGPLIGWNDDRGEFEVFAIHVAGHENHGPRTFDLVSANLAVAVEPILAILKSEATHIAGITPAELKTGA